MKSADHANLPQQPDGKLYWLTVILIAVLAALLACAAVYLRYSSEKAKPQPVVATTLEQGTVFPLPGRGSAWRNLPFTLSPGEETDLKTCLDLRRKIQRLV